MYYILTVFLQSNLFILQKLGTRTSVICQYYSCIIIVLLIIILFFNTFRIEYYLIQLITIVLKYSKIINS